MEKPQRLSQTDGIELLKNGCELQQPGVDLNTLTYVKEDTYKWVGLRDQAPTYLTEQEARNLIGSKVWYVDAI